MGTSLILGTRPTGSGREAVIPRSFPSGIALTNAAGNTVIAGGGAAAGSPVGYEAGEDAHGRCVVPVSLPGKWAMMDSDLTRTAHTATILKAPLTAFSAANITTYGEPIVVPLGPATRSIFACRSVATVHTTAPAIVPYIVWAEDYDIANKRFIGLEGVLRPDAATIGASALTLTLAAVADCTTLADSWLQSNPIPDLSGYDLKGAKYMFWLRQTAGAITGSKLTGVALLLN